jgi:plastocyanin
MKPDVRDRLFLPLVVPLLLVGAILLGVFLLAMLLLFNPYAVSLTLAILIGAGVIAYFAIEASRSSDLTRLKRGIVGLALFAPVVIGAAVATELIAVDADRMVDVEPHLVVPEGAPVVVADNIEFGVLDEETGEVDWDEVVVTVEAEEGDEVVFVFDNREAAPHDVDIFTSEEAMDAGDEDELIFGSDPFGGPEQRIYEFEAPEAGTYPFHCSVHPQMTGDFVFEAG